MMCQVLSNGRPRIVDARNSVAIYAWGAHYVVCKIDDEADIESYRLKSLSDATSKAMALGFAADKLGEIIPEFVEAVFDWRISS